MSPRLRTRRIIIADFFFLFLGPDESIGCPRNYFTSKLTTYGSHHTMFTCMLFFRITFCCTWTPKTVLLLFSSYTVSIFFLYLSYNMLCLLSVATPALCSEDLQCKLGDRLYCVKFSWFYSALTEKFYYITCD